MRRRIDKFFISRSISHFVIDTSIKVFAHSVHDCVTLTLDFDRVRRGPGFWHFNNDLLSDVLFQADIEQGTSFRQPFSLVGLG